MAQSPRSKTYVVGHTDLDGIARASAIARTLMEQGRDVEPVIVYSRRIPSTMPNTLAEALKTWISERVPPGSEVIFEDIPVDVRNPTTYIEALAQFARDRKVLWTDHHETDAPFLKRMQDAGIQVLWFGPSAYEYTMALVQWLGGNPQTIEHFAILSGFGDRDPHVIRVLRTRGEDIARWQAISDGMDVLIREISTRSDPADYRDFVHRLATSWQDVFAEASTRASEIPEPRDVVRISSRVVLVREQLHPSWGPKSLERVALRHGALYAIGVSQNPRDQTYQVRAITYWVAMVEDPSAVEIGRLSAFQRFLQQEGRQAYGPPGAPVVPGYTTFEQALASAEKLAKMIVESAYEPQVVSLISDRYVARALARDYGKIIELLERIASALERGASAKEEQVSLLRELYRSEPRTRYD